MRVSDPEERVMRDRLGTSEVAESIVEEIEEEVTPGPSIVKREEAIPVQLTGSLMPVPDVVMVVPDERDTEALSAELSPGAKSSVRGPSGVATCS